MGKATAGMQPRHVVFWNRNFQENISQNPSALSTLSQCSVHCHLRLQEHVSSSSILENEIRLVDISENIFWCISLRFCLFFTHVAGINDFVAKCNHFVLVISLVIFFQGLLYAHGIGSHRLRNDEGKGQLTKNTFTRLHLFYWRVLNSWIIHIISLVRAHPIQSATKLEPYNIRQTWWREIQSNTSFAICSSLRHCHSDTHTTHAHVKGTAPSRRICPPPLQQTLLPSFLPPSLPRGSGEQLFVRAYVDPGQ